MQSTQRVVVDEVNFASLFHFPRVLRSITMSFGASRLVIGLIMVAAIMLFGQVWDSFASAPFHPLGMLRGEAISDDGLKPFDATVTQSVASFNRVVKGVLKLDTAETYRGARDLFVNVPMALAEHAPAFTIFFGLYFCLVLAIGGGAISRMTACDVAGHERLGMGDAMVFAAAHWTRLLMALLLPLLLVCLVRFVIAALGWVLMLPWVDVIGGVLYGLLLLIGLVAAFLLLGYAAGFSLLIPATACENCDSAESLQRAYAYALGRPAHLLGYGLTALVGLAVGYVVVAIVAMTTLNVTATLVQLWSPSEAAAAAGGYSLFDLTAGAIPRPIAGTWHGLFAGSAIGFWETLVTALAAAYVFAYSFSASTIVYLLMRRACDGQDISEIWRPGMIPGTQSPLPIPAAPAAPGISVMPGAKPPTKARPAS